ncbi:MAG: glycine-rich domain-containing protein-like [Oligoflexales bacterium]
MKNSTQIMQAPNDILLIWHAHLLQPLKYKADVERLIQSHTQEDEIPNSEIVKLLLNPRLDELAKKNQAKPYSQEFVDADMELHEGFDWPLTIDFHRALTVQLHMFEKVKKFGPMSTQQIIRSIDRYEKFLQLSYKGQISPTLDIDIVWHSHMQMHGEYVSFFEEFGQPVLDHLFCEKEGVDMETDRVKISRTIREWREKYAEDYESFDNPWMSFVDSDNNEEDQHSAGSKADFACFVREKICSILKSNRVSLAEIENKDVPEFVERLRKNYMSRLTDECDSPLREMLCAMPVAAINFLFQDAYYVLNQGIPGKIVSIDFDRNHVATYIDDKGILRLSKKLR